MTGLGLMTNNESAFSASEQRAMSRGDKLSRMGLKGVDLMYGMGDLGLSITPSVGSTSMMLGKVSMYTSIGGAVSGSGLLGGAGGFLGTASNLANPNYLMMMMGMKTMQYGMNQSVIDPYSYTRMFESSALGSMRGVLGGQQSLLGAGGLSMSQSVGVGRYMETMRQSNRGLVSPEQINQFMSAAADMPSMQFVTNPEMAVDNMVKFTNMMTDLARKFKGKDKELIEAFRQFGQMGMTLDQSKRAFETTHAAGTFLNVDPSRIMGAGQSASQMAIGTGISQGTMYIDGGSNIKIIDNEIYKTSGYSGGNESSGIKVGTEHADIMTVENIDILNNYIHGLNGHCFSNISTVGSAPSAINPLSNVRIVGNTCTRGTYYLLMSLAKFYTGGLGLYMRNNIFSNPAGSFIGFIVSDPTLINSDYNIFYDLDAESDIFNTTLGLSEWQSATGQDTHSTFGNPLFTSGVHLSNTASGQGSTSPGVDAADESALTGYDIVDIGTTRTDATSDELNNLDIGYHYNFTYLETTENPPSSRRMILQY
jgi:hypothetical protein